MADVDLDYLESKARTFASVDPCLTVPVPSKELLGIITELRERRAADAWIPCSERMPEPSLPVLITGNAWPSAVVARLVIDAWDGTPSCWSDSDGDGSVFYLDDVTLWRQLPAPPERSGT